VISYGIVLTNRGTSSGTVGQAGGAGEKRATFWLVPGVWPGGRGDELKGGQKPFRNGTPV